MPENNKSFEDLFAGLNDFDSKQNDNKETETDDDNFLFNDEIDQTISDNNDFLDLNESDSSDNNNIEIFDYEDESDNDNKELIEDFTANEADSSKPFVLPNLLDTDESKDNTESTLNNTEENIKKDTALNDNKESESSVDNLLAETIVTPDGKSLEEILPSLNSGANSIDSQIKKYKNLSKDTINQKKYKKHKKRADEESKKAAGRIDSSKKFIQRNARYTEEEKLIMTSLGINPEDFTFILSKESGLTTADKAKIIDLGKKGTERYFKGKRFRTSIGDMDIIQFLAKFKFCNTRILSRIRSEQQSRTWRKLQRLKSGGIVADSEVIGMGTIWYLTEAGMALSGYPFQSYRQRAPKTSTLPPTIGANHIAACLWNNEINVLMLDDFPAHNRKVSKGGVIERVQGEELISELEIRSSLGKEANPNFTGEKGTYIEVGERARAMWYEWESEGRSTSSPEFEIGNEFLWVLYPDSGFTKSYHVPDLVLARDRGPNGEPRSIAVEIELNAKSRQRYIETLMAFKLDENIYERVVWVTPNSSITRMLIEISEEIGLTGFDVVPLINEDGIYKSKDIWYI